MLIVLFTAAGIWSADKLESEWGKDPSKVVVDEMVGVWIALLAVPVGNVWYILFAFLSLSHWVFVKWNSWKGESV